MTDRVAYIVAALALAFCVGLQAGRSEPDPMPKCPEDSVLVGVGSFERGHWDAFECGPARDDYVGA